MPNFDVVDSMRRLQEEILLLAQSIDLKKDIELQWEESDNPVVTTPEEILFNFVTPSTGDSSPSSRGSSVSTR